MLLIMETKISGDDAKDQAASLGFPKSCILDTKGLARDYGCFGIGMTYGCYRCCFSGFSGHYAIT